MQHKISYDHISKGYMDGLMKTGQYIRSCGLDPRLQELINSRVSQINGCAYCLDMHYKDAIHLGETEQRLYSLPAWRECPYYTLAERAALAFAEALTAGHLPKEMIEELAEHYSDTEIANLALAIVTINAWNRLNKALQSVPGTYQVGQYA